MNQETSNEISKLGKIIMLDFIILGKENLVITFSNQLIKFLSKGKDLETLKFIYEERNSVLDQLITKTQTAIFESKKFGETEDAILSALTKIYQDDEPINLMVPEAPLEQLRIQLTNLESEMGKIQLKLDEVDSKLEEE